MKVGVAGAGIMGRLLAFYLVNAGYQVTLFDQNQATDEDICSMAAGGLLTPYSELPKSDRLTLEMSVEALNVHWNSILTKINKNILFKKNGTLVLAHPENQAELTRLLDLIHSYHSESFCQKLSPGDIDQMEPELTKFQTGYFMSQEAHLDNQNLLRSLRSYLQAHHVHWHDQTFVKNVLSQTIETETQQHHFDLVCDCRGLGAKDIFPDLRGVRGELIWVHAPEVNISRPVRLLNPLYSLYIVPRPNQVYTLGASEIESEHRTPISVRTTLELLSSAYFLHSGFSEASIIKTVQQLRPTLTSGKPQIKFQDGMVAINGLYRHGFSLAPVIANEVLVWLQSGFSKLKYPQIWNQLK
jgi:glycine oxidase